MRRLARTLADLFARPAPQRPFRPWLEVLEERSLLDANGTGTITGAVFVDQNNSGARTAGEATLPGVQVNLTGTTDQGAAVSNSVTSDGGGAFSFLNVLPGTYQLKAGSVSSLLPGQAPGSFHLDGGQTVTQDVGFRGLVPQVVSLRMFLASTTSADFPSRPAGSGQTFVNSRANSPPFVASPIADVSVAANSSPTTIDLAGNFSDPDIADSTVRLDTSQGPINIELFDKQAPRTVANFLNYVQSGRYDNTIFHRLVPNFVLQGGGFTFNADAKPPSLTPVQADPAVQNEPGISNTQGTVAMAKLGNDPNSATDQFFFNLADNSSNLNNQNGGFTVFGKLVGPSDQATLTALAATPVSDQSKGDPNSPFNSIPLNNYKGTNFPADTTAANYALVSAAVVVHRPEALTYSVVANSNPALVTPVVANERLTLTYAPGQTGTATITVRATDTFGASADDTFNVTVS